MPPAGMPTEGSDGGCSWASRADTTVAGFDPVSTGKGEDTKNIDDGVTTIRRPQEEA
jgi:hypothetical protein